MTADEFWDCSPRELFREFEVGERRQRDAITRDRSLAWLIENLRRSGDKMPAFKTWIGRNDEQQASGPVDLIRQMQAISDLYGLKLRRTRKES